MLSATPSHARTLPGVHTEQEFARRVVDFFLGWYIPLRAPKGGTRLKASVSTFPYVCRIKTTASSFVFLALCIDDLKIIDHRQISLKKA